MVTYKADIEKKATTKRNTKNIKTKYNPCVNKLNQKGYSKYLHFKLLTMATSCSTKPLSKATLTTQIS